MQGQCLCGKVTIQTSENIINIGACHCHTCNQWGAAPFISIQLYYLNITGAEYLSIYRSSEWAERTFCNQCGTHIFYHLLQPSTYYVNVALFKGIITKAVSLEIFSDKKPTYYSFLNEDSRKLTEQEIIEMVNAPQ